MIDIDASAPQRAPSTFVTVVAWVFIVLAGMAAVVGIVQNVLVHVFFALSGTEAELAAATADPSVPAFARLLMDHVRLLLGLSLGVAVVVLVASIGLLRRRNWARLLFIGILVTAIVGQLVNAAVPLFLFRALPLPADVSEHVRNAWQLMLGGMAMSGMLIALGVGLVLGWIARRLASETVKAEFA